MTLLPWVGAQRRKRGADYYDCAACKEVCDYHYRRRLRCGFVRKADWIEHGDLPGEIRGVTGPNTPGHIALDPAVCPGFSCGLRSVAEVARAWMWWDKCQLEVRAPDPSELLLTLVERYAIEQNAVSSWELKQSTS